MRDVVQRLGGIPLAISMAANYFRNSQADIEELSARYFDDLAALDDSMAVPAGYDRTAFAAVWFAVEQIGKAAQARGQFGRESQALLYHASFLSPDRIEQQCDRLGRHRRPPMGMQARIVVAWSGDQDEPAVDLSAAKVPEG
ncbi:hypothetical protein [Rhodococcus wratislaviensis]|uniref:hypothetical protein n=1 Tax=Rhodococcus wratislaviensis TaxID=44752 RepID=UPI0012DF3B4D|nr:hypothetical protein [Rhodococcus wratislaviensis]